MNWRRTTRQWQASEEQEYPSELHSEVPGKQTLPHAHVARVKAMPIAAINRNPRDTQTKTFDIQAGLRWVLKKMLARQPLHVGYTASRTPLWPTTRILPINAYVREC